MGTLNLQLGFSEMAGDALVPTGPPDGLTSVRIRLAQHDGSEPVPATELSLAALSQRAQGAAPLTTALSGVPLETHLMLRIEGLDGDGERLCDFEQEIEVEESGETISVTLTPVEAVRSAMFSMLPFLELEPGVTELLRTEEALLKENGVLLFEGLLVYPLDPCTGWRLEVANQTMRVGPEGRARLLVSDLEGATTGILRHPTDDGLFTEFQVSQLSKGQIVENSLVMQLPFAGPCGMEGLAPGEELCTGGIPLPDPAELPLQATAQAIVEILPAPLHTINHCNQLVLAPTQFQERLNRGFYPEPKRFRINNAVELRAFTGDCEQTNGFINPGDIVRRDSRSSEIWYIGSTCHAFVAIGACPNENSSSDLFNIGQGIVEAGATAVAKLGNFFFDLPTQEILKPAVVPGDTLSCVDNHGGRYCQETLNGDVSLDFRTSGKGGIVIPTTEPELVVLVKLDEEVEFVVHNNGAFGETVVGASVLDIDGELLRTFKEYPISPPVTSQQASTPKLQLSTDPLLNNAPTAGTYNGYPTPGAPLELLLEESGFGGFGGKTDTIFHFEINPAVAKNLVRTTQKTNNML